MLRVFKYPLDIVDEQDLKLPSGARILHVDQQGDVPMLWALVEPGAPEELFRIRIVGTGHGVAKNLQFLGTVITFHGSLVWHVFLDKEAKQ